MKAHQPIIVPVILSGGVGSRLWPMSREDRPKQFHGITNANISIMRETVERISDPSMFQPPIAIGNQAHRFLMNEELKYAGISVPEIILEPCGRNTAPAIIIAALHIQLKKPDALMLVLPTDHYIHDCKGFIDGVKQAAEVAQQGKLVTFGIKPTYAEIGYGYIQCGQALGTGDACTIAAFVEKPDIHTAEQYLASGEYLWNSGMFLFPVRSVIEEMERLHPEMVSLAHQALAESQQDLNFIRLSENIFSRMPNISIDYALMENTKRAACVPLDCGWSDTGTWGALWRLSEQDDAQNVLVGEAYALKSSNCYIRNEKGPAIAAYGVDNLVVVSTKDAVLIARKDDASSLKELAEHVKSANPQLIKQNSHIYRPWGMYESLNNGDRYQVKHIHVKPGEKLSLQMHYHRAEHWIVVSGTAKVTCDDRVSILTENQSIYIPCGSRHRIENPGKIDLEIIEVQSGSYLGEDDIVRFEDEYNRATEELPAVPDAQEKQAEEKVA